jgi:hypothetical protein
MVNSIFLFTFVKMIQLLQKLIALILLGVFLTPKVIEVAHHLEHANESHCTEKTVHLHEKEHHCAVCDAIPTLFNFQTPPTFTLHFSQPERHEVVAAVRTKISQSISGCQSLRGPPTCC